MHIPITNREYRCYACGFPFEGEDLPDPTDGSPLRVFCSKLCEETYAL